MNYCKREIINMKSNAIVKAMVLGAIACSISATGIAADIYTQRAQDLHIYKMQPIHNKIYKARKNMMPCNPTGWIARILRLAHSLKWVHKYL